MWKDNMLFIGSLTLLLWLWAAMLLLDEWGKVVAWPFGVGGLLPTVGLWILHSEEDKYLQPLTIMR